MNAKQLAAADLRKLSVFLKGIIAIGEDLETLGSIEQAVADANSRVIKLQADEQEMKDRVAAAEAALDNANRKAADVRKEADEAAAETGRAATAKAAIILSEALASADRTQKAAEQSAADLDATLASRRAMLVGINSEVAMAQTRLDDVNDKLSDLRKRL